MTLAAIYAMTIPQLEHECANFTGAHADVAQYGWAGIDWIKATHGSLSISCDAKHPVEMAWMLRCNGKLAYGDILAVAVMRAVLILSAKA